MTSRAIQLRGDLAELPRLSGWVEGLAADFQLDDRRLYAIQLCLEEVVANLVLHAQPGSGAEIAITVHIEAEPLRVTVEDDAAAFDPTCAALAELPTSLAEANEGGLGLRLVRAFSASCDYGREARQNRLVMRFA